MKVSSISFTLLTTLLTLTSCCFISDCPGRGNKRMLYSFRPGIPPQVLPETQEAGDVEDQQLLDVPGKRNLGFLYDMPYHNFKTRAVDDQFYMNAPEKKDLRFLFDMLYNDNRPRVKPRQSKYFNTNCTQYIKLVSDLLRTIQLESGRSG